MSERHEPIVNYVFYIADQRHPWRLSAIERLAVRGGRVPYLWPTHGARAGVLVERWVGWYQAIEDIIHLMPPTTPARWQLARLPKEVRETMLFHQGVSRDHQGNEYETRGRAAGDPAYTMTSNGNQLGMRAYIVGGQYATNNSRTDRHVQTADQASPSRTVTPGSARDTRCFVGEWRRLTIRHLARFQSVPDSYQGLTSEINGNGVPPLVVQRIMESFYGR